MTFISENGPALLLYAYTHSHLGPARKDHSAPLLASEEFLLSWWGINCLAQGHFNGNCEDRGAAFSLTSLSWPFGETEPATSAIHVFRLPDLFCLHE